MLNNDEKIRLAIYEKTDIDDDTKLNLLTLYEEKKMELSHKVMKANKTYLEVYKKVTSECKDEVSKIKSLMEQSKYAEAKSQITKTRSALKDMESKVKETPSTLTDTAVAQCNTMLRNGLSAYTLKSAVNILLGDQKRMVTKATDTFMQNANNMTDEERKKADENINEFLKKKNLYLGDEVLKDVSWDMIKNGIEEISGKKSVTDVNKYKDKALKSIQKELEVLDKLENRLSKM